MSIIRISKKWVLKMLLDKHNFVFLLICNQISKYTYYDCFLIAYSTSHQPDWPAGQESTPDLNDCLGNVHCTNYTVHIDSVPTGILCSDQWTLHPTRHFQFVDKILGGRSYIPTGWSRKNMTWLINYILNNSYWIIEKKQSLCGLTIYVIEKNNFIFNYIV